MTTTAGGHEHTKGGSSTVVATRGGGTHDIGRSLIRALRNTGISVVYQDRDLRVLWTQNLPAAWASGDVIGKTDSDFLPPAQAEQLRAAKMAVFDTGQPESLEIHLPHNDGTRWFDVWIDADRDPEESSRGIITTAIDITEKKRREQTLKALLRELSHRSKNLLAIIQSIATQTGRYSGSIDTFLSRFRGRLQSLASSQDLVTSSNWRGADLRELVVSQVGRYSSDARRAVVFEGENPYLNPNAAIHIGLALHELAVNSVNYGALSRDGGSVTVAANLIPQGDDDQAALSLTWTEAIGHAVRTPNEKRFGSVALERVVPTSLNGTASVSFDNDMLRYELVIPGDSFELE
ncbi:two-component sensor histidine kinase [Mesorhizobium soli]|uniref:sensor histidine kinase n=1 Tax=Pseudaminobacter soli (ex Li et al. 2025) TaxID=1295366 RepID=UPI002474E400|nr:HWE histidine kinase domain-containing protein [Mesorhizobium soli]MDH6234171.1 two-component sensor histidine kinase [Mesorhizobium soli]